MSIYKKPSNSHKISQNFHPSLIFDNKASLLSDNIPKFHYTDTIHNVKQSRIFCRSIISKEKSFITLTPQIHNTIVALIQQPE
jgi:hypothetical protein